MINLKENLHWLIYSAGLFVYFFMLTQTTLTLSVIWLMFILYLWILVSILVQQYCFKCLLYVFCSSGIITAISLFFIKGIEEIPLPVGAILFKEEGIAQALILFFIFSVPLLIYNYHDMSWLDSKAPQIHKQEKRETTEIKDLITSEEWEEATIEDLESGSYEPI